MAGSDHVGIGSDFDGIDNTPEGLEDVSKFPDLFAELIRRGWSDADLKKLAGQNLLRVLRAAEATAARLQKATQPSTKTIEELDGTRTSVSGNRKSVSGAPLTRIVFSLPLTLFCPRSRSAAI